VTRNPELVNATDLDAYAEQRPREAQKLLPRLVRRLLANTTGVTGVPVWTDSSIGMTGYDGQAHGGAGTSFVPAVPRGAGARDEQRPRKKAQDDYCRRMNDPMGITPSPRSAVWLPCVIRPHEGLADIRTGPAARGCR
jgi:hypothetical protein